ncbi:hypothetical protein MYCTH_2119814 [Thermothelomyces thermophilus ATCC 42464]|uniref:AB hydrolase-1 domain-containing protein n=1 Tax=Thermothelomyces thermophilus (strain ATCC 42464 / BCRC 31852 / DSM 1799) TaxID=573729 RepID=G2QJB6_THET4|nr:uncharacterized protein MYCTH_2119814 [Thermothelomyces thermophilus ATCC 42464]AEO59673.1 hypothetical protein MYCTH_2119814 [Thermothelomyces thermophilus ATCC 42464]
METPPPGPRAMMVDIGEQQIVHNEGCDLHYGYQDKGPLITFIPGGNGHGRQFNKMMAALSGRFTCVTFDRRQMSASRVPWASTSPSFFGSSGGGFFAFQFALDFPDMADHLIATVGLLPDASALLDWFNHLLEVYETRGLEETSGIPKTEPPEPENVRIFWANEIPVLVAYIPNFCRLKENKTSSGLMRRIRCRDPFFARATVEQAKILDCPLHVVPGHHQWFEIETKEFHFPDMLETLIRKRNGS